MSPAIAKLIAQPSSHASECVRPLEKEDIPAVAQLYERIFAGQSGEPSDKLKSYLQEVFLTNPWYEETLPSLVCERHAKVVGFLGIVPRRMLMNGRPIRVAVSSKLMVSPQDRSGKIAFQLMKGLLAGSQELTISDLSTDGSHKLWQAFGGVVSLLHSIRWTRFLSPTLFAISRLTKNRIPSLITVLRPLAFCDVFAKRFAPFEPKLECPAEEEELTPQKLAESLEKLASDRVLRPEYTATSVAWLFDQTTKRVKHCTLQKVLVRTRDGRLAGWYIYQLCSGYIADVLQMYARQGSAALVFDRLSQHAWQRGAIALTGRIEPTFVKTLQCYRISLGLPGYWFVAHSAKPEILEAIHSGKAFLSRLEGEL